MAKQVGRSAARGGLLPVLLPLLALSLSGTPTALVGASLLRGGLPEYSRWGEQGGATSTSNAADASTGAGSNGTGSSCSFTFQGVSRTFERCVSLDGAGTVLAWSPSTANSGATTVFYQGSPEVPYGWSAWGVSPSGFMAGSDAVVGYGSASSPGTSRAAQYHMNMNLPQMVATGGGANSLLKAVPSSLATEVTNNGNTVSLLCDVTGLSGGGPVFVIWKAGPSADITSGQLTPHSSLAKQSITIDFSSGTASGPDTSIPNQSQKVAHAFLSAIGFGLLMPLGILVSRHLRVWADPLWFFAHIALQVLGYAVGVAGWAIGIWLKGVYGDISSAPSYQIAHYGIGIAIFCTATLQIMTPVVKPAKGAPVRIYWNLAHWGLGYASVILAIVNIFLGFSVLVSNPPTWSVDSITSSVVVVLTYRAYSPCCWDFLLAIVNTFLGFSVQSHDGIGYGNWRTVYIVLISTWGGLLLLLEPISWYKYFQNQKVDEERAKAEQSVANGKETPAASV